MTTTENKNRPANPIVKQMTPALQKTFLAIHKHWNRGVSIDIETRYAIGKEVQQVTGDEARYGQGVVEQLAKGLSTSPDTLYRCQDVVMAWSPEEFQQLVSRETVHGNRLQWTHLWQLALVHSAPTRRKLIKEVFDKGLNTEDVRRRIVEEFDQGPPPSTASKPRSPRSGLAAMTKYAEGYIERTTVWEEHVFDGLTESIPSHADPKLLESLEAAKAAHEQLRDKAEEYVQRLDQFIRDTKQGLSKGDRYEVTAATPKRLAHVQVATKVKDRVGKSTNSRVKFELMPV